MNLSDMFQLPFMKMALAAASLVGVFFSYLGVMVILRRIVFVGIALAQMSALGVAVAIFLEKDPTLFALGFTIIGVLLFAPDYGGKTIPREVFIGVGFAAAWALAILILSKASHGEASMLNLVRGNVLATTMKDLKYLAIVLGGVGIVHLVFYRSFLFSSFDPEMARTLKIPSGFWNFLFYLTLGIAVAAAIKVTGVLLTFAFLLLPGATALSLNRGLKVSYIVAAISALIASSVGLVFSFSHDLPTGPSIVAVSLVIFIVVLSLCRGFDFIKNRIGTLKKESPEQ